MNDYDIDDALDRCADDPVLFAAAQTLADLRDAANANSDGWAHWPAPARAARKLMELLQTSGPRPVTLAQLRAAQAPIKAFATRSGLNVKITLP